MLRKSETKWEEKWRFPSMSSKTELMLNSDSRREWLERRMYSSVLFHRWVIDKFKHSAYHFNWIINKYVRTLLLVERECSLIFSLIKVDRRIPKRSFENSVQSSLPVKTMEPVSMILLICMGTIVHVHPKFMETIVKLMIVLAKQILVSMEVFHSLSEDWTDEDCSGSCQGSSRQEQYCSCPPDHEGRWCERKVNHCWNRTCQNKGQCRPLVGLSFCECLQGSYSGDECQITAGRIVIRQSLSKSFAFVAILSISCVLIFVIVMDLLTYCCGIDPVRKERERIREEKRAKRRRPKIERFIYVHQSDPITPGRENPSSSIKHETDIWTLLLFSLIKESIVRSSDLEWRSVQFDTPHSQATETTKKRALEEIAICPRLSSWRCEKRHTWRLVILTDYFSTVTADNHSGYWICELLLRSLLFGADVHRSNVVLWIS